jgi:glycosyltransferase involved in cell wall biosynthesis
LGQPGALIVVRNTVSHDARVLRAAGVLRDLGLEPLIVGVMSEAQRRERETIRELPVLRLDPRSPMARARRRLRARQQPTPAAGLATGAPAKNVAATKLPALLVALHRVLTTLDFYRQGIATVRRLRPRLVHCNDYNTMWIGVAARLFGCAVVYDSHELWADRNGRREPRWWVLSWERLFFKAAHRTITTSPSYAAVLADRYGVDRPAVVRNIPLRAPAQATNGDGTSIAYVGGLMPGRGLEKAIEALVHAPAVKLVATGPGRTEYRHRLEELARSRGVSARFELREPVAPDAVANEIARATAGLVLIEPICLSYELSLPNKLFEYLSVGLPVVASALPAIEAVVRETRAGVLTDPADPRAIARAFEEVIEPARRSELRAAARAAAASLDPGRELAILASVYREAQRMAEGGDP